MKAYNQIASVYDYLIDWDNRLQNEERFFTHLFREQMPHSILDLGCGTGGHVLHWGEMGLNVMGIDSSKEMIALCKQKAESLEVDVEFLCMPMDQFNSKIEEKMDMITCLGNTLPHLLDPVKMQQFFNKIAGSLNPFGSAIFQILNYDLILENSRRDFPAKSRIVEDKEYVFMRFYDYHQERMLFNLVTAVRENGTWTSKSHSVYHHPWLFPELKEMALQAGFNTIMAYGNFAFEEFSPAQSESLIMVCDFQEEEPTLDQYKDKDHKGWTVDHE